MQILNRLEKHVKIELKKLKSGLGGLRILSFTWKELRIMKWQKKKKLQILLTTVT